MSKEPKKIPSEAESAAKTPPAPKSRDLKPVGVVLQSLVSVALLAVIVVACVKLGSPRPVRKKTPPKTVRSVQTATVQPHREGLKFDVDGEVVAFREIRVAPETQGRVVFKSENCRIGHTVRKGECLLRIDPVDYEIEQKRLQHEIAQSKAGIRETDVEIQNTNESIEIARQQLEIQERELKRYEAASDTPGRYSASQIDSVRQQMLNSKNTLTQLQNQLRKLEAGKESLNFALEVKQTQLEAAELNLERTVIHSPIDGLVVAYDVEENSYVTRGTPIVTIQDTSCLEIRCSLHKEEAAWLWQTRNDRQASAVGADSGRHGLAYDLPEIPVTVTYDLDGARWAWDGVLNAYDGAGFDPKTRMIPCRVRVTDPMKTKRVSDASLAAGASPVAGPPAPPTLMVGMFVSVMMEAQPSEPLLSIPEVALLPGDRVWCVRESKLQPFQVRVARTDHEEALVYADPSGLMANDQIVISPLASPVKGSEVMVLDESPVGIAENRTKKPTAPGMEDIANTRSRKQAPN